MGCILRHRIGFAASSARRDHRSHWRHRYEYRRRIDSPRRARAWLCGRPGGGRDSGALGRHACLRIRPYFPAARSGGKGQRDRASIVSKLPEPSAATSLLLQPLPLAGRWVVLLAGSLLLGGLLEWIKLRAALMLWPLAVAVLMQMTGGAVKVPRALTAGAQTIIGCLVAQSITPAII